jgi:hypothetical protein
MKNNNKKSLFSLMNDKWSIVAGTVYWLYIVASQLDIFFFLI